MRSSPHVPGPVSRELQRIGAGIHTARLRRNMSQQQLADRIGVSIHTVRAMEDGRASTSIGYFTHALWALGLLGTLSRAADPALDAEGIALEAGSRLRVDARRGRTISDDF